MPSSPLKRVLVTRSLHQASTLADQLQALGFESILIPTVSIAPPENYTALDAALQTLRTFHWILFTSANAVQAAAERATASPNAEPPTDLAPARPAPFPIDQLQAEPPPQVPHPLAVLFQLLEASLESATAPPHVKPGVAAIGPATAAALTALGLLPDLIPPQAIAESLAEALLPHITPGKTRILLIRAESARDTLPATLRAAGAEVTVAPAYRNLVPRDSIPLLQALFATPATWPDAITFTSSSTALNLLTLLEAARITLPQDGTHGRTILRASIGPITSQTLRHLGLPPHLEAPAATISSLVQTLAAHLRPQQT